MLPSLLRNIKAGGPRGGGIPRKVTINVRQEQSHSFAYLACFSFDGGIRKRKNLTNYCCLNVPI